MRVSIRFPVSENGEKVEIVITDSVCGGIIHILRMKEVGRQHVQGTGEGNKNESQKNEGILLFLDQINPL